MKHPGFSNPIRNSRWSSDFGAVFVLFALCGYYSVTTVQTQHPVGSQAGLQLAVQTLSEIPDGSVVAVIVRDARQDREFAEAIRRTMDEHGRSILPIVAGTPRDARRALESFGKEGTVPSWILTTQPASLWGPLQSGTFEQLSSTYPAYAKTQIRIPTPYVWSSFLTMENLWNILKQNADIAIIAIGMTLVIITGGIDLCVGSVLALSAVVTAVSIQTWGGGASAGPISFLLSGLAAVSLCGLCGLFNGVVVTVFRVPAFVVTLGMMMVARGCSLIIAVNYQSHLMGGGTRGTPEAVKIEADAFGALGYGTSMGVPNSVLLMLVLYAIFHVLMTRTAIGRCIYAVGGNPEAARLSGVPVRRILILVYIVCAALAGLGGVLDASRFVGGRPAAGELYELQVIAAVVVGGTSLSGGRGSIMGTLVGVLIIAVIQNGLNMALVESYEQKVIFGSLILAAVLVDQLKKRSSG